ncbi:MAG: amidohydrolase family protein [Saprospiraceae bacterium]
MLKKILFLFALVGKITFAQAQSIVIKNTNVITMESEAILWNHDVYIDGDTITSIIPTKSFQADQYFLIDGTDKYLIPGLSDMHAHFVSDDRIDSKHLYTEIEIPLVYGITQMRVMIGKPEHLKIREEINKDEILGPTLFLASPQLAGFSFTKVFNGQIVKTYEEAFEAVKKYKEQGYDFIKITFGVNDEAYSGLTKAGQEFDIPIIGHVPREEVLRSIKSGQDIEHLDQYLDGILSDDTPTKVGLSAFGLFQEESWETIAFIDTLKLNRIVDLTIESNIWNTPTNYFFVSSFARKRTLEELNNSPEWTWFSSEVRNELLSYRTPYWESPPPKEQREKYIKIRGIIIKKIFEKNGQILAGSDAPEWLNLYGLGLHRELQSLVYDANLTPFQALQTATTKPAEYLQLDNTGYIKQGFVANLVLLEANPLNRIDHTSKIAGLVYKGKWLPKKELQGKLTAAKNKLKKVSLLDNP